MINLVPWKKRLHGGNEGLVTQQGVQPLAGLRDEFDRLFDHWTHWHGLPENTSEFGWRWGFDVEDRDNEIVIRAEAPGFEPHDFDVQISGDLLSIKAQHNEEKKQGNGSHCRYGTFRRAITLPERVEASKVEARYRNGVLEVHVPKGERTKGRRIPIRV